METGNHPLLTQTPDTSAGFTDVTVNLSVVMYYENTTNQVEEKTVIGKLTIPQAKQYVLDLNEKNVFIQKKNVKESFKVSTIELYSLKK